MGAKTSPQVQAINRLAAAAEEQAQATAKVAKALEDLAVQVKYLGAGENGSQMGAVEFLGVQVRGGLAAVADAIKERSES